MEQWYKVQPKDLYLAHSTDKHAYPHPKRLLVLHGGSLQRALAAVYPTHAWKPELFEYQRRSRSTSPPTGKSTPRNTRRQGGSTFVMAMTSNSEVLDGNVRKYLERAMRISHLEDWYAVRKQDIMLLKDTRVGTEEVAAASTGVEAGASAPAVTAEQVKRYFRHVHDESMYSMLQRLYPGHVWHPWKFTHVPRSWWEPRDHQREFLLWVGKQLSMTSMDAWYTVSTEDIMRFGGAGLLRQHSRSVSAAVVTNFPEHTWQRYRFRQIRGPDKQT
jgi:hypothetical protein